MYHFLRRMPEIENDDYAMVTLIFYRMSTYSTITGTCYKLCIFIIIWKLWQ